MPRWGPVARDLLTVTAATGANSWALFVRSGELRCERYNNGTNLAAPRATISFSGGDQIEGQITLVPIDSAETVGDGSFVFKSGESSPATSIFAWDVDGDQVYEHALTAGDRATTPVYEGGYLYWLEWQQAYTATCTVSLMRSRCDLGDVTEIETFSLPEANGNSGGARIGFILTLAGDLVFSWYTNNEDTSHMLRIYSKSHTSGAAVDRSTASWDTYFGLTEHPDHEDWFDNLISGSSVYDPADSAAYLFANVSGDGAATGPLHRLTTVTTAANSWPDGTGDFAPGGGVTCVSRYDELVQVGTTDAVRATTPAGGTPEAFFPVDSDDDGPPTALFYIGPTA